MKIGISFGQFLGSLFRSKEREKGVELKKLTKPEAAQLAKERKRLKRQYRAASTRPGPKRSSKTTRERVTGRLRCRTNAGGGYMKVSRKVRVFDAKTTQLKKIWSI